MQQNFVSQRTAESLGQQGFFQLVQGGEFALVEGFEALGFFTEIIQFGDYFPLLYNARKWKTLVLKGAHVDVSLGAALP